MKQMFCSQRYGLIQPHTKVFLWEVPMWVDISPHMCGQGPWPGWPWSRPHLIRTVLHSFKYCTFILIYSSDCVLQQLNIDIKYFLNQVGIVAIEWCAEFNLQ